MIQQTEKYVTNMMKVDMCARALSLRVVVCHSIVLRWCRRSVNLPSQFQQWSHHEVSTQSPHQLINYTSNVNDVEEDM